jgi:hypothetical protein
VVLADVLPDPSRPASEVAASPLASPPQAAIPTATTMATAALIRLVAADMAGQSSGRRNPAIRPQGHAGGCRWRGVALSAGDQVLITAGAHANVVDELVDLAALRDRAPWTDEQAARYRELREAEHDLRISHARALRRFLAYRRHRERMQAPAEVEPDDATIAVIAHGLLGAVGVIQGAATMLIGRRDSLPVDKQVELLEMIEEQTGLLGGVLQDMVRGLPRQLHAVGSTRSG